MEEVLYGCKVCGKPMLTHFSLRIHRTCDACKAEQRRERNRKLDARRKAERHAAKAAMGLPGCQCHQCGKPIEGANRLWNGQWARRYCGNTCRQTAFRAFRARIGQPARPAKASKRAKRAS